MKAEFKSGDYVYYYKPCKDPSNGWDTIPARVVRVTTKMLYIKIHPELLEMRVLKSKCELQDDDENYY
jgi:hypothetical protein